MHLDSLKRAILEPHDIEHASSQITDAIIENCEELATIFPTERYSSLVHYLNENHPKLSNYQIIFDGGITRFLCLFGHAEDNSKLLTLALFEQNEWPKLHNEQLCLIVKSSRAYSLSRPSISTGTLGPSIDNILRAANSTRFECQYLYWQNWMEELRPSILYDAEFVRKICNQRLHVMIYKCLTTILHDSDQVHRLFSLDMFGFFRDVQRTWELRVGPETQFIAIFLKGDLNALGKAASELESSAFWRHPNILPLLVYNTLDNPEKNKDLYEVIVNSLSNSRRASKYFATWYYRKCITPTCTDSGFSLVIMKDFRIYKTDAAAHIENVIFQHLLDVDDVIDLCANSQLMVEILISCPNHYFQQIIKVFSIESIEYEFRSFYFHADSFQYVSVTRRRDLLRLGLLIHAIRRSDQEQKNKIPSSSFPVEGAGNIDIVMLWVGQEYFPDINRVIKALIDNQIPQIALQKVYAIGDRMFTGPVKMPRIVEYLHNLIDSDTMRWIQFLPEFEYEENLSVRYYTQYFLWNLVRKGSLDFDLMPVYLAQRIQSF